MSQTSDSTALAERRVDRSVADAIPAKGGINFDNAGQVMEFAKLMAGSGSAVPKHLRGQPGACLGILDDAIRFGFNPYGLARRSYFVNDTLAYEAAVFMAIVNARAPLKTRPDIAWEGEGADRVCVVTGEFLDGAVRTYRSPRFDAIHPKNSTMWKNDPDQQQSYFSLRAWARRWCPEIILGVHDIDELRDAAMVDVTPRPAPAGAKPRSLQEFADQPVDQPVDQPAEAVLKDEAGGVSPSPAAGHSSPRPPAVGDEVPAAGHEADERAAFDADTGELFDLHEAALSIMAAGMQLASRASLAADERLKRLELARPQWSADLQGHVFADTVATYAGKVTRGELSEEQARKYLTALAPSQ